MRYECRRRHLLLWSRVCLAPEWLWEDRGWIDYGRRGAVATWNLLVEAYRRVAVMNAESNDAR